MSQSAPARAALRRPLTHWYADPISCLQACMATVLLHAGIDPLCTLGLRWEFFCQPGRVSREEFYFPCRHESDVAKSIAPFSPVSSRWWCPPDPCDPLAALADHLSDDQPVIVAVDNYYLPFRPAYRDVHAAHLVVVSGVDAEAGKVSVLDSTPPAFDGAIAAADFLRAWGSANPADLQDAFFSSSEIRNRCLTVSVLGEVTPLDRPTVAAALRANVADLRADHADDPDQGTWAGLSGARRYLADLADCGRAGDIEALADAYPLGWAMQAQAYLHSELLRQLGVSWRLPALREAARAVSGVAHAWTGVRMTAAHGRSDRSVVGALGRHCDRLRHSYERAVGILDEVAGTVVE